MFKGYSTLQKVNTIAVGGHFGGHLEATKTPFGMDTYFEEIGILIGQ